MGWFFTKTEIRNSPSIQKGLSLETEQRYRKEGIQHIINLKLQMGLSMSTMATAAIYFHRFYMHHSFQDFPRFGMACACIFLAGKVEETPKKCKDIVLITKDVLSDARFLQLWPDVKTAIDNMMILERILLQTVKFHMEFNHPYEFLTKYFNALKASEKHLMMLKEMAWRLTHDSWHTTICLKWESEIIAIAAIYLACKLRRFKVTDWNGRTEKHKYWWDQFVEDLTTDFLDYICHQILDYYSSPVQPQQSTSSNVPSKHVNHLLPPPPPPPPRVLSPMEFSTRGFPTIPGSYPLEGFGLPPQSFPYLPPREAQHLKSPWPCDVVIKQEVDY